MRDRGSIWFGRPGIGRRIAFTMFISLVAIQAQAFLQLRFFSKPELRFTGVRWLATTTRTVADAVFASDPAARRAVLESFESRLPLTLTWTAQSPWDCRNGVPVRVTAALQATLARELAPTYSFFVSSQSLGAFFPVNQVRVSISPPQLADRLTQHAIGADEPDVLIPTHLRIAVRGPDGSWLGVTPIGFHDGGIPPGYPLLPLTLGGLIIAAFSVLTARSLVEPLERLVAAAREIGRGRSFVPVEGRGLHEFAAVADAFEEMQRRLLRFVADRTQMLAAISHDLRSSLTRLKIAAEVGEYSVDRTALLSEINEMHMMLESTLAFASGEALAASRRRLDLATLLISLVDEQVDAGQRARYAGPDHAEVMGSPVSLKRAFRNLIDNAITYGGSTDVRLDVDQDRLQVCIEDPGLGIPADRMDEALLPFRRLNAARSGKPGVGLGLTIAHDAVVSHGGTLQLENIPGGGFRVRVVLLASIAGPSGERSAPPAGPL